MTLMSTLFNLPALQLVLYTVESLLAVGVHGIDKKKTLNENLM